MITTMLIFASALAIWLVFWLWYVGLRRPIKPELIAAATRALDVTEIDPVQRENILQFLQQDDGLDFVMVNLMALNEPEGESRTLLNNYSRIFLGSLLKRAGHPVGFCRAAGGRVDQVNAQSDQEWPLVVWVRYRSRSDFAHMLIETVGSPHHEMKLAALAKTIAYPAAPWQITGGVKPLIFSLITILALLANSLLT